MLSASFGAKTDDFVQQTNAGADALVFSNAANPAMTADLRAHPDVADAFGVVRAFPEFTEVVGTDSDGQPIIEVDEWATTGIDDDFLSSNVPPLEDRDPRFDSDEAAFAALLSEPGALIAPKWFLADDDDDSVSFTPDHARDASVSPKAKRNKRQSPPSAAKQEPEVESSTMDDGDDILALPED